MSKRCQEPIGETTSVEPKEPKIEWTCPELIRLDAGAAEAAERFYADGSRTS